MARNGANVFARSRHDGRLDPKNGRVLNPHQRRAETNRAEGIRSRYQRCPRCKKLRMKWLDENWHFYARRRWGHYYGQLVCHVCLKRIEKLTNMDREIV